MPLWRKEKTPDNNLVRIRCHEIKDKETLESIIKRSVKPGTALITYPGTGLFTLVEKVYQCSSGECKVLTYVDLMFREKEELDVITESHVLLLTPYQYEYLKQKLKSLNQKSNIMYGVVECDKKHRKEYTKLMNMLRGILDNRDYGIRVEHISEKMIPYSTKIEGTKLTTLLPEYQLLFHKINRDHVKNTLASVLGYGVAFTLAANLSAPRVAHATLGVILQSFRDLGSDFISLLGMLIQGLTKKKGAIDIQTALYSANMQVYESFERKYNMSPLSLSSYHYYYRYKIRMKHKLIESRIKSMNKRIDEIKDEIKEYVSRIILENMEYYLAGPSRHQWRPGLRIKILDINIFNIDVKRMLMERFLAKIGSEIKYQNIYDIIDKHDNGKCSLKFECRSVFSDRQILREYEGFDFLRDSLSGHDVGQYGIGHIIPESVFYVFQPDPLLRAYVTTSIVNSLIDIARSDESESLRMAVAELDPRLESRFTIEGSIGGGGRDKSHVLVVAFDNMNGFLDIINTIIRIYNFGFIVPLDPGRLSNVDKAILEYVHGGKFWYLCPQCELRAGQRDPLADLSYGRYYCPASYRIVRSFMPYDYARLRAHYSQRVDMVAEGMVNPYSIVAGNVLEALGLMAEVDRAGGVRV